MATRVGPVTQEEFPGKFAYCDVCNVIHFLHVRACEAWMPVYKRKCEICGTHHRWHPASHKPRKDGGRRCIDRLSDSDGNICARYCSRCHHVVSRPANDVRVSLTCPKCKIGGRERAAAQEPPTRKRTHGADEPKYEPTCPTSPPDEPSSGEVSGRQSPAAVPMPLSAAPARVPASPLTDVTTSWSPASDWSYGAPFTTGMDDCDPPAKRYRWDAAVVAMYGDACDMARDATLYDMSMGKAHETTIMKINEFMDNIIAMSGGCSIMPRAPSGPRELAVDVPTSPPAVAVATAYFSPPPPESPVAMAIHDQAIGGGMLPTIPDDLATELYNQTAVPAGEISNSDMDIFCFLDDTWGRQGSLVAGVESGCGVADPSRSAVAPPAVQNIARMFESMRSVKVEETMKTLSTICARLRSLKERLPSVTDAEAGEVQEHIASLAVELATLREDPMFAARPLLRSTLARKKPSTEKAPVSVTLQRSSDDGATWSRESPLSERPLTSNRDKLAIEIAHNGGSPLEVVAILMAPNGAKNKEFTVSLIPLPPGPVAILKPGETLSTIALPMTPEVDEDTGCEIQYIRLMFRDPANAPSEEDPERHDGSDDAEAADESAPHCPTANAGWQYVTRRFACQFVRSS